MKNKIQTYIECIEEQRYYDAHEALEEIWFPRRFEKSSDIQLLKGFINAAVSFELHKRGRTKQSQKVWANYLKYRPLLYKVQTHKTDFYALSRYVERVHLQKSRTILRSFVSAPPLKTK